MRQSGPRRFLISLSSIISPPMAAALLAVGLTVGGLLVGRVPNGADPDLLYKPIKSELARSLRSGTLPFWSHRFGIGVPLVAESHAAAFYPPNWLLYGLLDVPFAYRLSMWLHYVALAATTFAYARTLGITPWGSALSSVAFSLCGFQAIHAGHEPFYCALPYLPLSLLLAHRYATYGGWVRMALLALCWGAQITLGHFQIPMWTAGLVILTACWRIIAGGLPLRRLLGLGLAMTWAIAVASVQLALTSEMTELASFNRSFIQLLTFSFPPAHLMQPAFPAIFSGLRDVADKTYWGKRMTTPNEAGLYIGTLPFILAWVGWVATGRDKEGVRNLAPWRLIVVASLSLACMPGAWADLYRLVVDLPVLGWFRAPGRYTLITSLGLALLAGHGLDRTLSTWRFRSGIGLGLAIGLASAVWTAIWMRQDDISSMMSPRALGFRLIASGILWIASLVMIAAWRSARIGSWGPVGLAMIELAALYHLAPVHYAWWPPTPSQSPILARLNQEPHVGLVGGKTGDLIVSAGFTVAYPYLGITAPPPNYLIAAADDPKRFMDAKDRMWLQRFGVTHAIFPEDISTYGLELLWVGPDPFLDVMAHDSSGSLKSRNWKLVAFPAPFPSAWASTQIESTRSGGDRGWAQIYSQLSIFPALNEVWFERPDLPPPMKLPFAKKAIVRKWDGREALVDHDNACVLVVRRTFYRGWSARVDNGPWRPVLKVDAGLQGVLLDRVGPSRIEFRYEPTGLRRFGLVSIAATASALVIIGYSTFRQRTERPPILGESADS